jgi:hypothetical protein
LKLTATNVTGSGLKALAELESLHTLYLDSGKVTDAGLKELSAFRKLKHLDLSFTEITDDGLKHLASLKGLAELNLIGAAKVTDKGIKALQGALPKCRIAR